MANQSDRNVTTVVIEVEPGWLFVKCGDPKPEKTRIEFFLNRTIEEWFAVRPNLVIDRTQVMTEDDETLGIHVWYHDDSGIGDDVSGLDRDDGDDSGDDEEDGDDLLFDGMPFDFSEVVPERLPKEHAEAVIEQALVSLHSVPKQFDTQIVITPRRLAVIVDRFAERGAIVPVETVEAELEEKLVGELETWLGEPNADYLLLQIGDSWFEGDEN